MTAKPTKDVDAAIRRLRANADVLICRRVYPGYGGSILGDLTAVLKLIDQYRSKALVEPMTATERDDDVRTILRDARYRAP